MKILARLGSVGLLCGLGFLLSAFPGCPGKVNWKNETYEERTIKPEPGQVKIPAALWSKLAGESQPETQFESLKVFFVEKNKGVLKGRNLAFNIVSGNGRLDLSDFVQPLRGSFYVAFEFLKDVAKADVQVFFVSSSIRRKLGSEVLGSGCDKFYDVTKLFAKAMTGDGFLLNTSEQRHVSALAGTYVFASHHEGKLHLASLIIRDDAHRALQCHH